MLEICVTRTPEKEPECNYSASVIAQDTDKDIALLQIHDIDLSGERVRFSDFAVLPLDMDYTPESDDPVTAVGYPGIGAGTLTQTRGIVSGTITWNGATYIKSDTLIAGGNSGGALLGENKKLIGIPTFLIGG